MTHNGVEWRPIPGFPGYEASTAGEIKGLKTGIVLKPWEVRWRTRPDTTYLKVGLYLDKKRYRRFVHRLILLTFNGLPPEGFDQGCHDNHDPHDNRAENLFWGTRVDNNVAAHSFEAKMRRLEAEEVREALAIRADKKGILDWVEDHTADNVCPF